MVRASKLSSVLLAGVLLMGCGGGSSTQEIVIRPIGDTMAFEEENKAFTVSAGATVKIVMENVATVDAMKHNVVILAKGLDDAAVNAIGIAAVTAGEASGYIPDDPNILFYTPLAGPGETTEVEFTAPAEPGEYRFICTFPGHFALMQGVMTVE